MTDWQKKLPPVRGIYKFAEPLKKHTWLNVGGPADVMFLPEDEADLQYFLQNKPAELPVFIMGNGSNLLVRDGGLSGVVIKLTTAFFQQISCDGDTLTCGAGVKNAALKKILPEKCLGGLEFICSIPGSIGGLMRSNAGCFGREIADILHKARVMDGQGNIFEATPEEFHFGYRSSNFPADWIILALSFKTHPAEATAITAIIEKQAAYRQTHQPQQVRTAGSTFKNPEGAKAWELIKKVGGDTLKIGGASFAAQHCNFMINDGSAQASDLENLGEEVRRRVKEQTGITLQWEVKVIGRKNGDD